MPRKKDEHHPDPSGLAAGDNLDDTTREFIKETNGEEEEQDRHCYVRAAAAGELPYYKDQVRGPGAPLPTVKDRARTVEPHPQLGHHQPANGGGNNNNNNNNNVNPPPAAAVSSTVMIPIAEGIPIDDNGEVEVPGQGTDLRKHMIWGAFLLGSVITVAVVVATSGSSSPASSPMTPSSIDSPPSTPATPNDPTPAAVNPPTPLVVVGGWVLGAAGASCNTACAAAGGACNAAGNDRVNDAATVTYVAETVLGLTCAETFSSTWTGAPYIWIPDSECFYQPNNHDCSYFNNQFSRNMCCCAADLADCPVSA